MVNMAIRFYCSSKAILKGSYTVDKKWEMKALQNIKCILENLVKILIKDLILFKCKFVLNMANWSQHKENVKIFVCITLKRKKRPNLRFVVYN